MRNTSTKAREERHIHEEMWSRLRRSQQTLYRGDEQAWNGNFATMLTLRQGLIQRKRWGVSKRDQEFDKELRLSLTAQLRLSVLNEPYSIGFVFNLLEMFRLLVIGDMQSVQNQNEPDSASVNDRILSIVAQAELGGAGNPDIYIINESLNLLHSQPSLG